MAKAKKKKRTPVRKTYVYIGPSVPMLEQGAILTGTAAAVMKALPSDPDVRALLVPVEELAEAKSRLNSGKNNLTEAVENLRMRYKI